MRLFIFALIIALFGTTIAEANGRRSLLRCSNRAVGCYGGAAFTGGGCYGGAAFTGYGVTSQVILQRQRVVYQPAPIVQEFVQPVRRSFYTAPINDCFNDCGAQLNFRTRGFYRGY